MDLLCQLPCNHAIYTCKKHLEQLQVQKHLFTYTFPTLEECKCRQGMQRWNYKNKLKDRLWDYE